MELRFRIEADGSLTVSSEKEVFLKNVYPGIDGHSVRALRVRREEAGIIWETAEGSIVCHVDKQDENCFELQFSLVDYLRPIHTFQFFYQADTDAEGFYQAAEGMGHDTGYYGRKSLLEKERLTGFGLCALQFSGCALTIYPTSQKHYETICEMEGCRLERYTDGSRRNSQEMVLHLSCGARMENVNRKNVDFAPLKFLMTESLEAGLEKAAEEIGRNMSARLFMPPAYHWCSWYYCYQNFD
ncbi:hypothetical protein, partial [Eisenbergiella porci]